MYTGILRYSDIGSGGWSLESSDGVTYTLIGDIASHFQNKQVSLKAKPMQGEALRSHHLKGMAKKKFDIKKCFFNIKMFLRKKIMNKKLLI